MDLSIHTVNIPTWNRYAIPLSLTWGKSATPIKHWSWTQLCPCTVEFTHRFPPLPAGCRVCFPLYFSRKKPQLGVFPSYYWLCGRSMYWPLQGGCFSGSWDFPVVSGVFVGLPAPQVVQSVTLTWQEPSCFPFHCFPFGVSHLAWAVFKSIIFLLTSSKGAN